MKVTGYFCPECGGMSAFHIGVINANKAKTKEEEILKCDCGWVGKWEDTREESTEW